MWSKIIYFIDRPNTPKHLIIVICVIEILTLSAFSKFH